MTEVGQRTMTSSTGSYIALCFLRLERIIEKGEKRVSEIKRAVKFRIVKTSLLNFGKSDGVHKATECDAEDGVS